MARTTQIEVAVVIDEDGEFRAAAAADFDAALTEAAELYRGEVADDHGAIGTRTVRVTLTVPVPEPIALVADLTGDDATALVAAKVA